MYEIVENGVACAVLEKINKDSNQLNITLNDTWLRTFLGLFGIIMLNSRHCAVTRKIFAGWCVDVNYSDSLIAVYMYLVIQNFYCCFMFILSKQAYLFWITLYIVWGLWEQFAWPLSSKRLNQFRSKETRNAIKTNEQPH